MVVPFDGLITKELLRSVLLWQLEMMPIFRGLSLNFLKVGSLWTLVSQQRLIGLQSNFFLRDIHMINFISAKGFGLLPSTVKVTRIYGLLSYKTGFFAISP